MRTECLQSIADIPVALWNALVPENDPFLRHEFLVALERHGCVGPGTGWLPCHVLCFDSKSRLEAATPLYLKDNSYGEFVFDWGWAEAYRRHGLAYYPKLVSAIPFTPATGPRLLISPDANRSAAETLIKHTLINMEHYRCSSLHWLFPTQQNMEILNEAGFLQRLGCQFHWSNPQYRDFDDFLDTLSSKKRKNIKRERRLVAQAGLTLNTLPGSQVSESQWHSFHSFYRSTFSRLGGIATLTLPFFLEIAATMGDQIILVLADNKEHRLVAAAISFRSDSTLYGRHWGCNAEYDSLHFETCYYQGIEYCIRHGLSTFEPGAQGEHKVYRGFLPKLTYSAHWINHPGFREAIGEFLVREREAVQIYTQEWMQHSPYREQ